MALRKYDTANSEQFITPVRGLYPEHSISVEEFKARNAGLLKNRWIETVPVNKGEKIYELYEPGTDGELVKESVQEWLCDNRHQINECISIALRNHEQSYAEWFKYIEEKSGPDELALYSLSRKFGVHTSVYNRSYVWTTLMKHTTRTDEEIFVLSGINLVYLGPTWYGIIRDICTPQPEPIVIKPITPSNQSKRISKTTCRDNTRGRVGKSSRSKCTVDQPKNTPTNRPKTLSEARLVNYGISVANITPSRKRSSRQDIDYVSLNEGYYEEEDSPSKKKRRKESHRPRSTPSVSRISANRKTNLPITTTEGEATDNTTPALPTTSGLLSGVPSTSPPVMSSTSISKMSETDRLPDLVVNQPVSKLNIDCHPPAASTLLSLSDALEDPPDEDNDDNALLMPIGGINIPVDIAPQEIKLDQVSVDKTIAGIIETEQLKRAFEKETSGEPTEAPDPSDRVQLPAQAEQNPDPPQTTEPNDDVTKKGSLKTKTYVLKKPEIKRSFKCSECNAVKSSIQKLNEHHRQRHNPQMCGVCNRTFALASSLTRHMYEHEDKRFNCDSCDFSSHFASELEVHKINHRKNPSYQCMYANCGKWFRRKWDLNLHVQKHKGIELKCDHDDCKFKTSTKKQLMEHQKKHTDDYPHECKICHKGFKYRSGLKRHRDKDHKDS